MAEKYELAALDYVGGMKYKDMAEKYEVSIDTVKSWKKRHWQDLKKGAPKTLKSVHTNKKSADKKTSAPKNDESVVFFDNNERPALEEEPQSEKSFTDRQILFISYYVRYWNATKAYRKAYQCDYDTARNNGSRLLANASIRAEVVRQRDSITADALLDKRVLVQKWMDIAFADITDYMRFGTEEEIVRDYETGEPEIDLNGKVKTRSYSYVLLNGSDEVDGTLITEVKQGKDGISVKLVDKMTALKFLTQHLDVLNEREKKWLQEEQLRLNVEKTQIDIENARGNTDKQIEIIVRPKAKRGSDET